MAQHPGQTTLKGVQRGRVNHFPGEIIPMGDCPHCEKFPSRVQSESPQEQFVSLPPCPLHVTPCKKGTSNFFVATLSVLVHGDEIPSEPPFLKAEQTQFYQPILVWQLPSPLIILVALLWTPSSLSTSFL